MKHLGLALLKGVAKGVVHYGSAGLIPGVAMDWLIDGGEAICNDVWEYWGKDRKEQERRQAIEEVAQATAAELRDEIEVIAREELADRPDERATLAALLHQLQPCVRRTLRRPEDPQGLTTAAWRQFDSPSALLPLIPTRIPKFQAGMQPIAGIDLELAEFLGIGGFGEVWKAVNPLFSAKEPVALKFCLDPQAARSLKNEVKLLNLVIEKGKHPGIVELRNTYFRSDVPALEYEYVAGGDLGDLIQQWHANGQLPAVPLIRESIRELATTLDFAHQHGIVHRDLKPANILVPMLNRSGLRFKIADFGIGSLQATVENRVPNRGMSISRRMSETITGSHTPLYSSPEQTAGRLASDPSDDIYSLGVIWSQMLFGDLGCGVRGGRKWQEELRARGITNEEIELLIDCSEEREHRPKNAAEFLRRLDEAMPVADESEVDTK